MKIPHFIPNEPDNWHCLQACYRMAVAALTGERISLAQTEKETAFIAGKATWPYGALISLAERGLQVEQIEALPCRELLKDPQGVSLKYFGEEVGAWVNSNSDWPTEVVRIKACLANPRVKIAERPATLEDLRRELAAGRIAIACVNSRVLAGLEGYVGHSVIVEDFCDGVYTLQNPGLPPEPNQKVPAELFEKAWFCPTPSVANLTIVGRA